jgi:TM2 domain-containing membrane protein YozV
MSCDDSIGTGHHKIRSGGSGSGITHALLVILIVTVLILLVVLLIIHRQRAKENVTRLVDHFQRSLQYRTIEKDLAEQHQAGQQAGHHQPPSAEQVNV